MAARFRLLMRLVRLQLTYDVYKPYVNPKAGAKQLLWVSRGAVAFFGLVMACVSVIFYKVGVLFWQLPRQHTQNAPSMSSCGCHAALVMACTMIILYKVHPLLSQQSFAQNSRPGMWPHLRLAKSFRTSERMCSLSLTSDSCA